MFQAGLEDEDELGEEDMWVDRAAYLADADDLHVTRLESSEVVFDKRKVRCA